MAEQAAYIGAPAGVCTPPSLNRSAVLRGTSIAVSPLPDSRDAPPHTQISLLGEPLKDISHLSVQGSSSGQHRGHLRAYSQGDGASFVPDLPFKPGEVVNVRGRSTVHGKSKSFGFYFVVSVPDTIPVTAAGRSPAPASGSASEYQSFQSRPELHPPKIKLNAVAPTASGADVMLAPYAGAGQDGPADPRRARQRAVS